jgi:spermidine synthase
LSRGAYAYFHGAYYDASHQVRSEDDFVRHLIEDNQVILYKEGIHAPVAVVKNPHGEMAMRISGKVEASLAPDGGYNNDLPHQVLAGHLPMVLHPDPKNVLTLGLGGGVTLGTLTLYPVESIDSLEISPEVIEAARDYFFSANRRALTNIKVRNVIGDGRNHLEYTRRKYDVITSVPSNPWIAGIGNLFTVEFFQTCRRRLNPGGLLCNWIHKINMRAEDFRSVVRTFLEAFGDHAQLWDLGYDCLLVGSTAPVRFDARRFQRLLEDPEIAHDFANLGIKGPETFFRYHLFDAEDMRRYAGESAPLNTDSCPILEFSCPFGLYGHAFDTFDSLAATSPSDLSPAWISGMDSSLERAKSIQGSFRRYQKAESHFEELRNELSRVKGEAGPDLLAQRKLLRSALDILEDFKAIEQSTRSGGDDWLQDRANNMAASALGVPRGATLRATLCSVFVMYAQKGQSAEQKLEHLEEAARYAGEDVRSTLEFAMECLNLKRPEKAMGPVQAVLLTAPENPQLLQTLGALQGASGQLDPALLSFSKALQNAKEPGLRSRIHQDTALALQMARRPEDALQEYEKALKENPANETAKARLAQLRAQLQQSPGGTK